ncbi:Anti-anti-sigma regulatory factor (antagonist of anti-sigma factor) [Alteribacillus persepolensis]|uniref:Anti-anti-sigma regulatory factor (Antagonist of anti-sigma factor) n=1 Tax=Alteribacillus persepolensis TaxID=568899 RepID=A0A1G8J1V3_9BACI|nr:STAS domain-containing protein [Alteribacillus persepolensis]SDI25245.1 Anti-anti-sigma regulatory factor (antagonist of anti-sigma factor) [Alteribacillus persepolensis]
MDLTYEKGQTIKDFLVQNREAFEQQLLREAVNVREKIKEIQAIGNIDLIQNAHKLVMHVIEQQEEELIQFSRQEGEIWAKFKLTLTFKLEWVQAIRRTIWNFLYDYNEKTENKQTSQDFFELEKNINDYIDKFLNSFFLSYSTYKDELIESQNRLVENLSVPIIPVTSEVYVLPLIGTVDQARMSTIEEKVLMEIGEKRIRTLVLDLSGIAEMEEVVVNHLMKLIDGVSIMGSKPIITGVRPDVVRKMIALGVYFEKKAETKGSLQQALADFFTTANNES